MKNKDRVFFENVTGFCFIVIAAVYIIGGIIGIIFK